MNLPLLLAADRLTVDGLRAAASAAGFSLPPSERDPARALILGNAEASPENVAALGAALSSFASGGDAIGPFPFILKRVRVDGKWRLSPRRAPLDLRQFLKGDRARRLVAAVCPAPLKGGTLTAFHDPGDRGAVCAKSATVAGSRVSGYPTISKAIVVSGATGTWFAFLGAPKGVLGSRTLSVVPFGRAASRTFEQPAPVGSGG